VDERDERDERERARPNSRGLRGKERREERRGKERREERNGEMRNERRKKGEGEVPLFFLSLSLVKDLNDIPRLHKQAGRD
jgi:hypothetical protein